MHLCTYIVNGVATVHEFACVFFFRIRSVSDAPACGRDLMPCNGTYRRASVHFCFCLNQISQQKACTGASGAKGPNGRKDLIPCSGEH